MVFVAFVCCLNESIAAYDKRNNNRHMGLDNNRKG